VTQWIKDVSWFEWGTLVFAVTVLTAIGAIGMWAWTAYNEAMLVAP
jgi:hypothetical protein